MGETEQGLSWFPRPPPAHTATYCKILKKEKTKQNKKTVMQMIKTNQTKKSCCRCQVREKSEAILYSPV